MGVQADSAYTARVDAIRSEASGIGVTGIPTFFIVEEASWAASRMKSSPPPRGRTTK